MSDRPYAPLSASIVLSPSLNSIILVSYALITNKTFYHSIELEEALYGWRGHNADNTQQDSKVIMNNLLLF
jgi:hypothetical protein